MSQTPTRPFASALVAFTALFLLPRALPAQTIGKPAPEIELSQLDGHKLKLSSLRGHPVVVTFWGTWCPPCREEFPALVAARRQHRSSGLEIVAVNQRDQELSTRDVQQFTHEFGVDFPVLLDARGRTRRSYHLIGLPTTVFIDRAGIVQVVHPGPISRAQLDRALATIISAN